MVEIEIGLNELYQQRYTVRITFFSCTNYREIIHTYYRLTDMTTLQYRQSRISDWCNIEKQITLVEPSDMLRTH